MQDIRSFIAQSFTDGISNTYILTLRADGTMSVGGRQVSAWATGAVPTLPTLISALDRTISELCRPKKYRSTKFAAFQGGDRARSVAGHFHALLQLPSDCDAAEFIERLRARWHSKVSASFHTSELNTSVYAEPLQTKNGFTVYCNRWEGQDLDPNIKPVVTKSMRV